MKSSEALSTLHGSIFCQNWFSRPTVWVSARRLRMILAPVFFQRLPEARTRYFTSLLQALTRSRGCRLGPGGDANRPWSLLLRNERD